MTKITSNLEKKTFVGLVIDKFAEMGTFKSTIKRIEHKEGLDLQYKTAQRYARQWLGVKLNDPATKEKTDEFYKELHELMKEQPAEPVKATPVKASTKAPTVETITEAEAEAPVPDAQPAQTFWATPEAAPYLKLASWLAATDKGIINGTVTEAKEFISKLDDYTEKLQELIVKQTEQELKTLLRQVKECETVLDRSEVEDIWQEVATERGELVVIPFTRETETPTVEPFNTDAA